VAAAIAALAVPLILGALTAPRRQAQSSAAIAERPKFEVISVKPHKPDTSGPEYMLTMTQRGRLLYTGVKLDTLISSAYQLKPAQARLISGMPKWAASQVFDVEARAPGDPPHEQMLLMLQSLLADRFKLAIHPETRQLPVYALVLMKAGRTGSQLQPHSDAAECLKLAPGQPAPTSDFGVIPPPPPVCGRFMSGAHRIAGNNVTMEMLAEDLGAAPSMDRPVVDRTGLSGSFDLTLEYTPREQLDSQPGPDASASDPSAPPSVFTALQEQLGLKLEPQTGPVDVLVVDHVEQPSPN